MLFLYPRLYSISVYKMDTHFENNGIGDFVYQTFVVSKYSKHQRIGNYIFASFFLVVDNVNFLFVSWKSDGV